MKSLLRRRRRMMMMIVVLVVQTMSRKIPGAKKEVVALFGKKQGK
jgi:hypothetical protein